MTDATATNANAAPAAAAAAAPASPPSNPAASIAAAPAGQALEGQTAGSPVYRPEGLPDHFVKETTNATLDEVFKAYSGLRTRMGEIGTVPDKEDAYAFQPAETVAPYVPNLEGDEVFKSARAAALKHKLTDKQFNGFLNDVLGHLVGTGAVEPPYYPAKEAALVAPAGADAAAATAAFDQLSRDNAAYLAALVAQGKLPKDAADAATGQLYRGHMNLVLKAIRAEAKADRPAVGGEGAGAALTEKDLRKMQADPRARYGDPAYDPDFVRQIDDGYKRLFPDTAA